MENSKIEWCDHTFNPWEGCTKVSPGCANCYAELARAIRWKTVKWGKGQPRRLTSEANWRKPLRWNAEASRTIFFDGGQRRRIFCASLADWNDQEVPEEWRERLFQLIRDTKLLDWLLLTKRTENLEKYEFPENVWLGASIENQAMADLRIPQLLKAKARIKFLSVEPMLEEITLNPLTVDWVICGGESGPGRRDLNIEWVKKLERQVHLAGRRFFMKQDSGEHPGIQGRIPDEIWKFKEFPR